MLTSHLLLGLPSRHFPRYFSTKIQNSFIFSHICLRYKYVFSSNTVYSLSSKYEIIFYTYKTIFIIIPLYILMYHGIAHLEIEDGR